MPSNYLVYVDASLTGYGFKITGGIHLDIDIASYWEEEEKQGLTNNVAEWMALLKAMEFVHGLCLDNVTFLTDSELVVRQYNGHYKIKKEELKGFYEQTHRLSEEFVSIKVEHIYGKDNPADSLSRRFEVK